MILPPSLTFWFKQFLSTVTSVVISIAYAICLVVIGSRSAQAEIESIIINVPIYKQTALDGLIDQAETLVSEVIERQFSQAADFPVIKVVVVGDRDGEILPLLTTQVSRSQWYENPRVRAWTAYYDASFALLQRHDFSEGIVIAGISMGTPNVDSSNRALERTFQVDQAYDEGRLVGGALQENLSRLD